MKHRNHPSISPLYPQRPWHLHHQRSAGLTPPRRTATAVRRQRANGRAAAGGREAVVKAEALRPGQSVDHVGPWEASGDFNG
jgi:hypothetical protein